MDIDYPVLARDVAVVQLFGQVTITGASGAIASQNSLGFTVTRTSAGLYKVTLARPYPELLFSDMKCNLATATECVTQRTAQDMALGTISHLNTTNGVAADPADGSVLDFMIVLKDSTVIP